MGEHARVRGHEPVPIADCQLSVVDRLLAARKADDNFLSLFRSFYFCFCPFLPLLLLSSLFLCRLIDTRAARACYSAFGISDFRSNYYFFFLRFCSLSFYVFLSLSLQVSTPPHGGGSTEIGVISRRARNSRCSTRHAKTSSTICFRDDESATKCWCICVCEQAAFDHICSLEK